MHWIALSWQPESGVEPSVEPEVVMPTPEALGWWALQFTPHVVWLDEALLLEVSACERLWGGRPALWRSIFKLNPAQTPVQRAQGATSLVALARLRLASRGEGTPADVLAALPLDTLSAARPHLDLLARLGCQTWGDVAALPRAGLVRRFGVGLREALDVAWALRPESHRWLTLPEVFGQKLELPALAETAPALMWSANRLLAALQIWLRARQRCVLGLELQWTLDLRRFNGVELPPHQSLTVRTAEPTQDMAHLRRLMSEQLAFTRLAAPVNALYLRSLETVPWAGISRGFLPEDNRTGDPLHELVERLSARLGPQQVLKAVAQADHRPEHMQTWQPALQGRSFSSARAGEASGGGSGRGHTALATSGVPSVPKTTKASKPRGARPCLPPDGEGVKPEPHLGSLYPSWLLRQPLRLAMEGERPCYQGLLRKLVGPQRVEAGWWGSGRQDEEGDGYDEEGGRPALRDYYIAESPQAGLVWIYRERPSARAPDAAPRWFLQGLYA